MRRVKIREDETRRNINGGSDTVLCVSINQGNQGNQGGFRSGGKIGSAEFLSGSLAVV